MNSKANLLLSALLQGTFCMLLCASCATEKRGIYEVVHRDRFQDGHEAILLKSEDNGSMLFVVEYKGQKVGEFGVMPEENRAILYRYRSNNPSDAAALFYSKGGKMVSLDTTHHGTDKVTLLDQDGDGYPEARWTYIPNKGRLVEELSPQVISSRRKVEMPPQKRGSRSAASGGELRGQNQGASPHTP